MQMWKGQSYWGRKYCETCYGPLVLLSPFGASSELEYPRILVLLMARPPGYLLPSFLKLYSTANNTELMNQKLKSFLFLATF